MKLCPLVALSIVCRRIPPSPPSPAARSAPSRKSRSLPHSRAARERQRDNRGPPLQPAPPFPPRPYAPTKHDGAHPHLDHRPLGQEDPGGAVDRLGCASFIFRVSSHTTVSFRLLSLFRIRRPPPPSSQLTRHQHHHHHHHHRHQHHNPPTKQASVDDLKAKFAQAKPQYYPARQRFSLPPRDGDKRGEPLKDGSRLSDYGLKTGATLQFKDLGPQVSVC
jgi:hypothetical protein